VTRPSSLEVKRPTGVTLFLLLFIRPWGQTLLNIVAGYGAHVLDPDAYVVYFLADLVTVAGGLAGVGFA